MCVLRKRPKNSIGQHFVVFGKQDAHAGCSFILCDSSRGYD
jgi:hypothetical protein